MFAVHVRLGFVSSSLGKTASNWTEWFLDASCCYTVKWFSTWPTWKWAHNEKGLGAWTLRCRVEFHFFNWVALQNPESSCVYRSWFNSAGKAFGCFRHHVKYMISTQDTQRHWQAGENGGVALSVEIDIIFPSLGRCVLRNATSSGRIFKKCAGMAR